jgi:hypothetical protein
LISNFARVVLHTLAEEGVLIAETFDMLVTRLLTSTVSLMHVWVGSYSDVIAQRSDCRKQFAGQSQVSISAKSTKRKTLIRSFKIQLVI